MRCKNKPLVIREFSGVDRVNWPVTGGVPFPRGDIYGTENIRVTDEQDNSLPVQIWELCRWDDGSLRWAALHLPVTVGAMKTRNLSLEYGEGITPVVGENGISLDTKKDVIIAETSAVSISISLHPLQFGGGLACGTDILSPVPEDGFRITDISGKTYYAHAVNVKEEISGPLYRLLRITGNHVAGDGDILFDFMLRLHIFAGAPFVQVDYTFINREDSQETELEEIVFQVSLSSVAPERVLAGWCRDLHESDRGLKIELDVPTFRTGMYPNGKVFAADGQPLPGVRGYGWLDYSGSKGGAAVAIRDYSEQYPKKTVACDGKLQMHFWPSGAGSLKFHQGMAKTHMMMLYLHGGDGKQARVSEMAHGFNERLVFVPQPWYLETGVFGEVFPYLPGEYPQIERRMRDEFISWESTNRSLGMIDWGDFPQPEGEGRERFMANNEHDFMHAVLLQWMRTGERKYLRALDASVYHTLDIDTVHHNPEEPWQVGGVRTHNENHWGGSVHYGGRQVVTPCHMWAEGLAEYYCLFAENRALEGARGICNVLVGLQERGYYWGEGRIPGWACISLIPTYEVSEDKRYINLAKEIIYSVLPKQQEDGSWLLQYGFHSVRCPFQSTIFATGMMYYLRAVQDEKIKKAFLKFCDWRVKGSVMPDGSVYYVEAWDYYRSRYGGDLREPLGFAYFLTGDAKYIEHGMEGHESCFSGSGKDLLQGWAWYVNPQTGELIKTFGHVLAYNWRGNLRFMYWAHKSGRLRDLPAF